VIDWHYLLERLIAIVLNGSCSFKLGLGHCLFGLDFQCLFLHLFLGLLDVDHHHSSLLLLGDDFGDQVLQLHLKDGDLIRGMSQLRETFFVLPDDGVYLVTLGAQEALEGLDKHQVGGGSDVVETLELLIVSLGELGDTLLHVHANLDNTFSIVKINL
jgi:hypothetical protein